MTQIDVQKAKETYGTPSYIFNTDVLNRRISMIRKQLGPDNSICYAMKANQFLLQSLENAVDRLEVCSPGEYEICMRKGMNPEKIIISGVNKTQESIERILHIGSGLGIFTIESPLHFTILQEAAKKFSIKLNVLLRLSSGNQFGMDKGVLEEVLVKCIKSDYMILRGIHFYSGTQKKSDKITKELESLNEYGHYLRNQYGLANLELEYGPGLMIQYFEAEHSIDIVESLRCLRKDLDKLDGYKHVTVEMGRFMASDCGMYLTSVVDVKKTQERNYCIVDGGIHQINYYGQIMGMKKPYMDLIGKKKNTPSKWNICGSLCTVSDVLVKDAEFPEICIGDYFVFKNCGAYSVTEGMALFLCRDLPQILLFSEEKGYEVVREMIATDQFMN